MPEPKHALDPGGGTATAGAGGAFGIGLATSAGMGLVDNVSNLIFGKAIQKQQLKGQKQALAQANEAQLDLWNKTNYEAQKAHIENAGLNPGLIYGMSGGGGATTGTPAGMPTAVGEPQGLTKNGMALMNMQLIGAQIENLKSQANKNNVEATKTAGIDTRIGEATLPKIIAETKNEEQRNKLLILQETGMQIANDIADATQYYQMGKIEADWQKAVQEFRSAQTKANVDAATQETQIKNIGADLVIKGLIQKSIKAGTILTETQTNEIGHKIRVLYKDAETRRMEWETGAKNANTTANRLEWDRQMKDVADSLKLTVETVQDILQALTLKGAMQGGRTEVKGFGR